LSECLRAASGRGVVDEQTVGERIGVQETLLIISGPIPNIGAGRVGDEAHLAVVGIEDAAFVHEAGVFAGGAMRVLGVVQIAVVVPVGAASNTGTMPLGVVPLAPA